MAIKQNWVAVCIGVILFLVPFFWLPSNELDIGGDNSRLYLYDPQAYLNAAGTYSIDPQGTQKIQPNQNLFPLISIFALIRNISHSDSLPAILEKSLKLAGSFWFMYLVVYELFSFIRVKKNEFILEVSAVLSSVVYAFSPAVVENMRYALLTHNQVFLNVAVFYGLLKYLKTDRAIYLFYVLFLTVLFAPNFALVAPPPLFAFYPLTVLFLACYVKFILRKSVIRRPLVIAMFLGLGLHAYHILPELYFLRNSSSELSARIFEATKQINPGVAYFNAIVGLAKVSANILFETPSLIGKWTLLIMPFIIVMSFLLKNNTPLTKTLRFISIFYLITLYLISANITALGVHLYQFLYYIPGFGMFRNFFGQFQFIYSFFYALLFGVACGSILIRIKPKISFGLSIVIFVLLIYRAVPFIEGKVVNDSMLYTTSVKTTPVMDTRYEETLQFLRSLPVDGKTLTVPLSDFYMQVIHGTNNGAYLGPSTISFLTGRGDFVAYHYLAPFTESLMKASREKNYEDIQKMLSALSVRYIFHNSDSLIYDDTFSAFPYSYMRTSLPTTQHGYKEFVSKLTEKMIYENGPYKIYEVAASKFIPLITTPKHLHVYKDDGKSWDTANKSFFASLDLLDRQNAYIEVKDCLTVYDNNTCTQKTLEFNPVSDVVFTKVNPTKYTITIPSVDTPFVLLFSNLYNPSWKLYRKSDTPSKSYINRIIVPLTKYLFNDPDIFQTRGLSSILDDKHIPLNGYANAWILSPSDLNEGSNEFIIEAKDQQIYYMSALVSLVAVSIYLGWGVTFLKK